MRFLRRLSIRVRITLGTLVVAIVCFAVVAVLVHLLVERLLADSTATLLEADIAPFETAIQVEPDDGADAPADGQLVEVIGPNGVVSMSTLPASLRDAIGDPAALPSSPTEVRVGDSRYLVFAQPVTQVDGTWTILAARDQSAAQVVLDTLTTGLIVGLAILVVIFGGASWLLTGSALRPVGRLRRSAEALTTDPSGGLLPVTPARDEIQSLAVTLNHLIEELRAAAARERQIVSDASHELRTPLAVLQTQLELMRRGDRSRVDEDIADAERATARLTHLVGELLELSRLEAAGGAPGHATVDDLVDEAGAAVDRGRLRSTGRTILLDVHVEHGAGAAAAAIRASTFGRMLDNLLSNSIAAGKDGGRIVVDLHASSDELVALVTDDGPGIDAEFLPHAFDRFSRPDQARSPGTGTGLGLAIVAAAAASAGGTVGLENVAPHGARASIRLPLRIGPESG